MLQLVNKLSARLWGRSTKPKMKTILPAKPGSGGAPWSPAEVQLLLSCEQSQRQLTVELPGVETSCQTVLLGADLTTNQLLLNRLNPALPAGLEATEAPFWLCLTLATGQYRVYVKPREWLAGRQILVDILAADFSLPGTPSQGRRVEFANQTAPTVQLRLPSGQGVRAKVLSLSVTTAEVAIDARDAAAFRVPLTGISSTIAFNDSFQLQGHMRSRFPVRRQSATKAGCQHVVQLEFTHMDADYQRQLKAFLHACQPPRSVAA